jgi:hypothetical protein
MLPFSSHISYKVITPLFDPNQAVLYSLFPVRKGEKESFITYQDEVSNKKNAVFRKRSPVRNEKTIIS